MSSTPLAYINQLDLAQTTEPKPNHYQAQLSWMFEPASVVIESGELKFDDPKIPSVELSAGDRSVIVANLEGIFDYDGILTLKLNNGQTLTQAVHWRKFNGINRITWKFTINSTGQLYGKLFWGMPEELSAQVLSFQLSSLDMDDGNSFTVVAKKNGIALSALQGDTKHRIDWIAKLRSGQKLESALMMTTPAIVIQPQAIGPRSLGHQHTLQQGQVNQVWNIPQTTYHVPFGQDQVTHQDNAMTFAQTPHIAPDSLVSAAGNDYVQSFSRDQVNDIPSYQTAVDNAPKQALSTTTQKTLTHVGDSQVTHAGTTIINTHVLHKQHKIDSPYISNQHQGKRTETLNGDTYTRNHINYSRTSNQEVAQHGTLTQQYNSSMNDVEQLTQTVGTHQLQVSTQVLAAQTKVVTRNTTITAGSVNFGMVSSGPMAKIPGCPQIFVAYQTPDLWTQKIQPRAQEMTSYNKLLPPSLTTPHAEAIALGDRKLPHPTSDLMDAKVADAAPPVTEHRYPMEPGDRLLTVKTVFPPVIVNLRTDAKDENSRTKLWTTEKGKPNELEYFKTMGKNATIFIHGYNVGYGDFAKQIKSVNLDTVMQAAMVGMSPYVLDINMSAQPSTLCRTLNQLEQQFPKLKLGLASGLPLPDNLKSGDDADDDPLNGTDAHNWFIHMEDNINRATNQFDGSDYSKYQRMIHVAWSGDTGTLNFDGSKGAEGAADLAGAKLADLLNQLHSAGIKTNIIAHSLGNRVLLKALDTFAKPATIEHIFMWEAAVADTALSSNIELDNSGNFNQHYPKAAACAKKITVLSNRYDDAVSLPYWLATFLGGSAVPMVNALKSWALRVAPLVGISPLLTALLWDKLKASLVETIANAYPDKTGDLEVLFNDEDFKNCLFYYAKGYAYALAAEHLGTSENRERDPYEIVAQKLIILAARYNKSNAMGLWGCPRVIAETELKGKFTPADMSQWAVGHSYMRIPSADVMKYGYKRYIIDQGSGIKNFGVYNTALFDNYTG